MRKPTDDGMKKSARRAGGCRSAVRRTGRESGWKRASRLFLTGVSVAYAVAIVWTSLTYAYSGGYRGTPSSAPVESATRWRVIFGSGPRGSNGRLQASGGGFSPLGVRAYVQTAAKNAGVSPSAAEWIVAHESSHRPFVTGDGGESRGLWQISRIYHPEVSDRCAYDVKCSTAWSLRRILGGNINEWSTWKYRKRSAANNSL